MFQASHIQVARSLGVPHKNPLAFLDAWHGIKEGGMLNKSIRNLNHMPEREIDKYLNVSENFTLNLFKLMEILNSG